MNVNITPNMTSEPAERVAEDRRLKNTCRDVEGIFLGMLMKSGLKPMIEPEEDESHSSSMMEATIEQVANQMAGTESLGIARMLYEQVAGKAKMSERQAP